MTDPYLSNDESVVLATDKVIFRSLPFSALVLTNKRILLIQTRGDTLSAEEILLLNLRSAEVDEHAVPDPVLALSVGTTAGGIQHETITFVQKDKKQRKDECSAWAQKLSGQIVPYFGEGTLFKRPGAPKEPAVVAEAEPVPRATTVRKAPAAGKERAVPPEPAGSSRKISSPNEILAKHERLSGLTFPDIPPIAPESESTARTPRRKFVAVAVLVLILLAVISGAFLFTQYLQPKTGQPPAPVMTTPLVTPEPTTAPIPTTNAAPAPATNTTEMLPPTQQETLSQPPTPTPPPAAPQIPIPKTGVWARVQYAGTFTGSVGEGGTFRQVAGTGERFYQFIIKRGTVKAIFQKEEGSSDKLTVEIYQDGVLIGHGATTVPYGVVNIQTEIKAATPTATVIPNTTAVNTTGTG
jgi:hypothetical protein